MTTEMTLPHHRLRPVTSHQNALLKQMRKAFHQGKLTAEGYCPIEGVRMLEEAIRSGVRLIAVLFSASAEAQAARLLPQIGSHVQTIVAPEEVFAGAVATEHSQGVAALVKLKDCSLEAILQRPRPAVLVAVGLQDPGNLGTVFRSAEAFAISGVVLTEGTASPYNAKTVRAGAGSLFRISCAQADLESILPQLRQHGVRLLGTSPHVGKGTPLNSANLDGPLALFVGNEGAGLPRRLLSQLDETIFIPHSPTVESLNAGVAAGIVLYEIWQQRNASAAKPRDTEK